MTHANASGSGAPSSPGQGGAGALRRYLPVLAVIAVIAVVAVIVAIVSSGGDDESATGPDTSTDAPADAPAEGTDGDETGDVETDPFASRAFPITFQEAVETGTENDYDWGPNCDVDRGRIAYPSRLSPPCVPVFTGDNGGATTPGVTGDTIRVGYYVPQPDPVSDALLELSGAYDPPEDVVATRESYTALFQEMDETYGRSIELVRIDGSGSSTDATAARADADRAAELDLFAVINGPTQVKEWAERLAQNGILCVGNCLIAQPETFYNQNQTYIYGTGPAPEQAARHTIELISKQLAGKPAEFAGDPELAERERSFALLTYDTPDGNFSSTWEKFKDELAATGTEIDEHVTYFLDLATAQEDARTIVTALKASGATSVIFSGDPIIPIYFTEEATAQDFFPEWVLSGTVLADTTTLARPYDPVQWANAFGYSGIQVRFPQEEGPAYRSHEWWYGEPPPSENSYGITFGAHQLLMAGIHLAGPSLTPQTFHDALYNARPVESGPGGLGTILDYDDDGGFWPTADNNGLDNAALIWWDPEATGIDETGAEGTGMYRYVEGGRRFLPGEWPTDPLPLFDPEGSVTLYESTPDELRPPDYPPNPASPVAAGG